MANSLLPELWTKIFGYLTAPKDFQSVINTCQKWHNLLEDEKPEFLFAQVLPILLKDYSGDSTPSTKCIFPIFPLETMLSMREVNREWRKNVDKELRDQSPYLPYLPEANLTTAAELEEFMIKAEPLSLQRGNPFVARDLRAYITNSEAAQALRRLLAAYGRMIHTANITLMNNVTSPLELSEVLQFLPFIQDLKIEAVFSSETHRHQLPISFPPMSKLNRLNMHAMFDHDAREHGREWEQLLFSSLLRSCSASLTNLCAKEQNFLLSGINELIPNVKNIFVIGPLYAKENENVLSELQLKLEGIRIASLITPSEKFLTSLNTFRETLTFLSLHITNAETFDPTHLQVFPSLEKLHLNINSNSLEDFPAETRAKFSIIPGLCPNLEELMIMFHRAFRGINLKSATEVISSLFKKLKVIELSRAEDQYSGRY